MEEEKLEATESVETVERIFKKCGDIVFTVEAGDRHYLFTCISCNDIFAQLDEFATHIDIQHSDDILFKMEEEEVDCNEYDTVIQLDDETTQYTVAVEETTEIDEIIQIKEDDEFIKEQAVAVEEEFEYIKEEDEEEDLAQHEIDEDLHEMKLEQRENEEADTESDCDINADDASIGIPRIDETMNSIDQKVLTLAVILDYEKQRTLWDPKLQTADVAYKNEIYDKIAKSVNKQLSLHLDGATVKQMIKKLNRFYRSELQKQEKAILAGEKYILPWYFDKLRFLDRRKNDNDTDDNGASNKGLGLPLPYLNDEQHAEIFKTYESFTCLWDVQHIGFHTKKVRQEAMEEMTKTLKRKMDLHYTPEQLQRKLYHIRYTCTQEKQRKLECERLKKEFKPSTKFYSQLLFLEDNVHPFKCPYCEEIFNAPQPYNVHKSKHDGSRPFKCPICKRGFMTAGNCTVHLRRHTQEYPYSCKVCGKAFPSSSEVTIHMRYHSGEKPYICEICGLSFYRPSYLEYHRRRHENNRSFKCSLCPKAFYDNHLLKEHSKVHLNIRDKVCNTCGKAFTCAKHLRQHKQIHADVKKYVCKICGKDFAQYAGLSGHMKSHGTTISGVKDLVDSGILE